MFLDLFYGLREEGVPVSLQEWRALLTALEKGLHGTSLLRFYHLARSCLVKSETHFDAFDRVFARTMRGVEGTFGDDVTEKVLDWLRDPKNFGELTPEQLAELERLSSDELMRRFLERLAEQTERHDGGDRWVGTGGRSAFGHGAEFADQVILHGAAVVRRLQADQVAGGEQPQHAAVLRQGDQGAWRRQRRVQEETDAVAQAARAQQRG